MLSNMKTEPRLDREGGLRLLSGALKLPNSFEGDRNELRAAFETRFGAAAIQKPTKGYDND